MEREEAVPELRKLLRLTKDTFAITLPPKYRKALELGPGDYVSLSLLDLKTLVIRRQEPPKKI